MKKGTFNLEAGSEFTLPDKFTVQDSRNKGRFPDTPKIISVYREKSENVCHFSLTLELLDNSKRVGIFVPDDTEAGDVLRLIWVDETCACAIIVRRYQPGQKFVAWSHSRDSSSDLACLKRADLVALVKRQTKLIPKVGLQPGCAISVPELEAYQTGMLHNGLASKTGDKVSGPIILSHISDLSNEKVTVATCLKPDGTIEQNYILIGKGKYVPATEDEITKLVNGIHSKKWAFM